MTTYITKAASDHAAAFCEGAESQAPLIAQLERQVDAMRSAILHAIATSECISAGADVCDEWALELLALRLAAGRGADHVALLEDRVKQLTEAVEVQEARLEMAEATKRVSQQRFARIRELEEQRGGLLAALGTQAAKDVFAERQRQITAEGWTPEHDDAHVGGQMAVAAGYYALACGFPHERGIGGGRIPQYWPWDKEWWKPSDKRRNLVKAAALILAEIERLDRAAIAGAKGGAA